MTLVDSLHVSTSFCCCFVAATHTYTVYHTEAADSTARIISAADHNTYGTRMGKLKISKSQFMKIKPVALLGP